MRHSASMSLSTQEIHTRVRPSAKSDESNDGHILLNISRLVYKGLQGSTFWPITRIGSAMS